MDISDTPSLAIVDGADDHDLAEVERGSEHKGASSPPHQTWSKTGTSSPLSPSIDGMIPGVSIDLDKDDKETGIAEGKKLGQQDWTIY